MLSNKLNCNSCLLQFTLITVNCQQAQDSLQTPQCFYIACQTEMYVSPIAVQNRHFDLSLLIYIVTNTDTKLSNKVGENKLVHTVHIQSSTLLWLKQISGEHFGSEVPQTESTMPRRGAGSLSLSLLASQAPETNHKTEPWQGIKRWNWIKIHTNPGRES